MRTIFIRHNLGSNSEILNDLWNRCEIAIHYQNIMSINPLDFSQPGCKSLERLLDYCETGAVVGLVCNSIKPSKMLVGIIPSGSKIIPIDRYGENYYYKTVQLHDVQEISLADYPVLGAIQPRLTTLTEWPSASVVLNAIVKREEIIPSVDVLSPGQLEVLCFEYLKAKGILQALILPIGRNLLHVDIMGLGNNDKTIIAQVTHSLDPKRIRDKLKVLRDYQAAERELYFFGPKSMFVGDTVVNFIPIESVFDALMNDPNELYRKMIDKMI